MDHELKQRLIGAVVVTALAAIFIPMLFDDPVDTSGKAVKELTIPQAPAETSQNLPADKAEVLNRSDIELNASEVNEEGAENAADETSVGDASNERQSGQVGLNDVTKSSVPDSPENELNEGIPSDKAEAAGLDTGIVEDASSLADKQSPKKANETLKKPPQSLDTPTEEPVSKPEVAEKTKAKPVIAEKSKAIEKSQKDTAKKPTSKLVRYSIQAGSFNKRENAQALVEKLRKQGMPATIVAKGELFRVKVGPSLDKDKAKEMKAKLDKQNIKGLLTSE